MSCSCTKKSSAWPLILVVLAIGAVMYIRGRHAPTPAMFDQAVTLDVALKQSEETGKPVFVLATADWCPGCQSLKRGALTDETLASAIQERAIVVYLDATSSSSQGHADVGRLGIGGLPTMLIIDDGKEIGRTGARSASKLLTWFDKAVPQLKAAEPATEMGTEMIAVSEPGEG